MENPLSARSLPMTEIKIEKKKPIWPWLLLVVLIAVLLIWLLAGRNGQDGDRTPVTADVERAKEAIDPAAEQRDKVVADFLTFVEEDGDRMGLDHVYTSEAMVKLTEAIRAVAGRHDYEIKAGVDVVTEDVNVITDDRQEDVHANRLKNASGVLTDALQEIQQEFYPDLAGEVAELRSASDSIRGEVLLLNQRDEVKSYFEQAAEVLRNMTN
jgi:hypothetical protein